MDYPKIIIKYARLLDPFIIEASKTKYPEWVPPSIGEVEKRVELFKKEWGGYGEKILGGIYAATHLAFKRNTIDVYVVSGISRDMSDPIIIRSRYEPLEFVNILTHELIHRLFSNNHKQFPTTMLTQKFPHERQRTLNHIYLFAILQQIYLDVLREPTRLDIDLERAQKSTDKEYIRAWEIVKERGYEKLIEELQTIVQ